LHGINKKLGEGAAKLVARIPARISPLGVCGGLESLQGSLPPKSVIRFCTRQTDITADFNEATTPVVNLDDLGGFWLAALPGLDEMLPPRRRFVTFM
jgi:hypothetical protein